MDVLIWMLYYINDIYGCCIIQIDIRKKINTLILWYRNIGIGSVLGVRIFVTMRWKKIWHQTLIWKIPKNQTYYTMLLSGYFRNLNAYDKCISAKVYTFLMSNKLHLKNWKKKLLNDYLKYVLNFNAAHIFLIVC